MSTQQALAAARAIAIVDRDAVRDIVPMAVGVAPFGLVIGVTMGELGIAPGLGLTASFLLYGGSVQMAVLALIGSGSGVLAVVLSTLLVNARLALYSATMADRFRSQPGWFRWLAPHLMVDQTVALAQDRAATTGGATFRRYWLTLGAVLTLVWLAAIAVGMHVGPLLPTGLPLEVVTAALFVSLLVPKLGDRGANAAAAAATVGAVVFRPLPSGAGLLCGIAAGVVAAVIVTTEDET